MPSSPSSPTTSALDLPLAGVDGHQHSLASLAGPKGTVVTFIASGCPTARAYEDRLMALHEAGRETGVPLVAINANNPHLSPPDTLAEMTKRASDRQFNFPYLKDADGTLARSFGAVCTPHAFLLDSGLRVVYRGRIDDSRLGDRISSTDLQHAITDLLAGRPARVAETEPFGCAIVW